MQMKYSLCKATTIENTQQPVFNSWWMRERERQKWFRCMRNVNFNNNFWAASDGGARKHDNVSSSQQIRCKTGNFPMYILSFGVKLIASLILWYVYVHTHLSFTDVRYFYSADNATRKWASIWILYADKNSSTLHTIWDNLTEDFRIK